MARFYSDILDSQLSKPLPNVTLNLTKHIRSLHPESQFVPTVVSSNDAFPLSEYLVTVLQTHPNIEATQSHIIYDYDGSKAHQKTFPDIIAGVITFTYGNTEFRAYKATWTKGWESFWFYGLVYDGPDDVLGQELATAVYRYANDLKKEIWVYDGGYWSKSKELYKSIRAASWDDVVLKDEFKEGLRRDTETFFKSKEVYESLGMTWKRGILLLGPPGNGKTESIKALINEFGKSALYVKSFTTNCGPEHGVRSIFNHARKHSPCILILEDLDSMVTPKVRSFFLNELDGLAQNDGFLTIATTNHPERIDDAILNRPSRFDVKYNFALPEHELRRTFASRWIRKIEGPAKIQGVTFETNVEEIAENVAKKTEGWSFAFLKELFVSFLLRVAHDNSQRVLGSKSGQANGSATQPTAEAVLLNQIEALSAQILKRKEKDERKKRRAEKAKKKAKEAKENGVSEDEDSEDSSCEDEDDCCAPPPEVEVERSFGGVNF